MSNHYLQFGDWLVIVLYLLGMVALGLWFGKDQRNTRDYFLGGRSLPWWGVGLSIVATETSALTFIGVPALAYGGNLTFIQIIIGYVIARIILAVVLVPHYFKGEIYSPYQLFANAFGPSARRTAGVFFLIAGTLAAGVRVYVTCIPIQLMLGLHVLPAILLFVILSLAYTYVGGIKAVVWTEFAQFFLFLAGGLFTLWYISTTMDGSFAGVLKEAAAAGKLHWFNSHFSLSMPFNIWMGIIGATVMVMSTHGADQLIVQRVLACRSVTDGRRSLMLSAIVIFPLFLIFLITGAMLWVYYQHHSFGIPLPETQAGFGQDDYVFPIFILTVMPPIVKGFMIVAILAAAMSSVSAALSALTSVTTMDFFKGLSSAKHDEAYYLRFSKRLTLVWALVLIVVAYASREVRFVLNWAFSLNGLTNGAMLGGLALALWWKKGRATPLVAGMITALACMIVLSQIHWTRTVGGAEQSVGLAWPWYTLIGSLITIAVASILRVAAVRQEE